MYWVREKESRMGFYNNIIPWLR